MADPIIALGGVAFGVSDAAMEALDRSRSWRWQSAEVIGARPRRSYTGPGEETISLDGVVYPGQLGDDDALDRLEELADRGEPHPLTDGNGRSFGMWTIENIDRKETAFAAGGRPRRIGWTMKLGRFPDDQ